MFFIWYIKWDGWEVIWQKMIFFLIFMFFAFLFKGHYSDNFWCILYKFMIKIIYDRFSKAVKVFFLMLFFSKHISLHFCLRGITLTIFYLNYSNLSQKWIFQKMKKFSSWLLIKKTDSLATNDDFQFFKTAIFDLKNDNCSLKNQYFLFEFALYV